MKCYIVRVLTDCYRTKEIVRVFANDIQKVKNYIKEHYKNYSHFWIEVCDDEE